MKDIKRGAVCFLIAAVLLGSLAYGVDDGPIVIDPLRQPPPDEIAQLPDYLNVPTGEPKPSVSRDGIKSGEEIQPDTSAADDAEETPAEEDVSLLSDVGNGIKNIIKGQYNKAKESRDKLKDAKTGFKWYDNNKNIIDFFLMFALFLSIAYLGLGRVFQGSSAAKGLSIAVGLALAVAALKAGVTPGFFIPFVKNALFFIIFMVVFFILRNEHLLGGQGIIRAVIALVLAFVITYVAFNVYNLTLEGDEQVELSEGAGKTWTWMKGIFADPTRTQVDEYGILMKEKENEIDSIGARYGTEYKGKSANEKVDIIATAINSRINELEKETSPEKKKKNEDAIANMKKDRTELYDLLKRHNENMREREELLGFPSLTVPVVGFDSESVKVGDTLVCSITTESKIEDVNKGIKGAIYYSYMFDNCKYKGKDDIKFTQQKSVSCVVGNENTVSCMVSANYYSLDDKTKLLGDVYSEWVSLKVEGGEEGASGEPEGDEGEGSGDEGEDDASGDGEGKPAAVSGISLTPRLASIEARWAVVAGSDGYIIYYKKEGVDDSTVKNIEAGSAARDSVISSLESDTQYQVKIVAVKDGKEGPGSWNNVKTLSLKEAAEPVAKVGGLTAEAGDGMITLKWDKVEGTGIEYLVYKKIGEGEFDDDKDFYKKTTTTDMKIDGLANDKEYQFRVKAKNKYGTPGEYSQVVKATPRATPSDDSGPDQPAGPPDSGGETAKPGKVTDLKASEITVDSITLTWTAPSDGGAVGSYTVYYWKEGETPPLTEKDITSMTATIDGLTANTEYNIRVLAKNKDGEGLGDTIAVTTEVDEAPKTKLAALKKATKDLQDLTAALKEAKDKKYTEAILQITKEIISKKGEIERLKKELENLRKK